MLLFLSLVAVYVICSMQTRRHISQPEVLNGIPKRGLRFQKALVSSQIFYWSIFGVASLLTLASIDLGADDQSFFGHLVVLLPIAACALSFRHVAQLLKLRAMHDEAVPAEEQQHPTHSRFEELLKEFDSNPSAENLESLLRQLGPPPRFFSARNRRKWRRQWGDLGL